MDGKLIEFIETALPPKSVIIIIIQAQRAALLDIMDILLIVEEWTSNK